MLKSKRMAIYMFLTEIGACKAKMKVFDQQPEMERHELAWILDAALSNNVVELIQNMIAFLDCQSKQYFMEQSVMVAAREYARLPYADNTFYSRFIALLDCNDLGLDYETLPF